MTYAASVTKQQQQPCEFQVIKREDARVIAYCPSQSHAIRVAMALNFLDRQAFALEPPEMAPASQKPPEHELLCASCSHRFPTSRIGTVRVLYSGQEEAHPCCPMCGEILALGATTTPTFAEWSAQYKK